MKVTHHVVALIKRLAREAGNESLVEACLKCEQGGKGLFAARDKVRRAFEETIANQEFAESMETK